MAPNIDKGSTHAKIKHVKFNCIISENNLYITLGERDIAWRRIEGVDDESRSNPSTRGEVLGTRFKQN